jgi:hypothetical protein
MKPLTLPRRRYSYGRNPTPYIMHNTLLRRRCTAPHATTLLELLITPVHHPLGLIDTCSVLYPVAFASCKRVDFFCILFLAGTVWDAGERRECWAADHNCTYEICLTCAPLPLFLCSFQGKWVISPC